MRWAFSVLLVGGVIQEAILAALGYFDAENRHYVPNPVIECLFAPVDSANCHALVSVLPVLRWQALTFKDLKKK